MVLQHLETPLTGKYGKLRQAARSSGDAEGQRSGYEEGILWQQCQEAHDVLGGGNPPSSASL